MGFFDTDNPLAAPTAPTVDSNAKAATVLADGRTPPAKFLRLDRCFDLCFDLLLPGRRRRLLRDGGMAFIYYM